MSPQCATVPGARRRHCIRRSTSHVPLTFDLVDTWMGRSVGGCQYHVAHPGGRTTPPFRSMPTRPRRGAWRASSAPVTRRARWRCRRTQRNPNFPFTLDLRARADRAGAPSPERRRLPMTSLLDHVLSAIRRRRPLRRAARRGRRAARALGRLRSLARLRRRGPGDRRHAVADRARDPRERHHLQRLRRPPGRRPALGSRSAAAAAAGAGMGRRSRPASRSAPSC